MSGKVRKMKLSWKITITTMLTALAVSLLVSVISIRYMQNYLLNVSRSHTTSVAKTAAALIDGDKLIELQAGEEDTEVYQEILAQLQTFLMDDDVAYIYTMRKEGDSVQFVVDADTEEGAAIGEEYETYDKIEEAFKGEVTLDDEVSTDEWGSFYSAFAPITDDKGEVLAIVGVDCTTDIIDEKVDKMVKTLLIVEFVCILAAFIISMVIGRLMARNVLTINRKMEELAGSDGDLTQEIRIHSGDEIENVADSFNSFMEKLRSMMLSVKDNGEKLEGATNQTNQEIQEATDELNQISHTLNEITQAMQENGSSIAEIQNAALAAKSMSEDLYRQTKSGADYADDVSHTAEQAMETCQASKMQMSQVVGEISGTLAERIEASMEIEKIVQLTKDIINISEQTQLLALNASIEAARAGEEGKGFAVVADEIGKLADETARTAMEIESINQFTVDTVNDLVRTSEKMIQYVETEVSRDYDNMVGIGQSYHNDSVEFMNQLKGFRKLSEQLSEHMAAIEGHICQIMAVLEEETAGITNVAEASESIHGKMQTASTNGQINEEIVGELGEVLDKFIL